MFLCDTVGYYGHYADNPKKLGLAPRVVEMPIYPAQMAHLKAVAGRLRGATRYVLADEVVAAATHLLMSRPASLLSATQVLRLPYPTMFVEWHEPARQGARDELSIVEVVAKPMPHRMGFLVCADETGRRGVVEFMWSHNHGAYGSHSGVENIPQVCPISLEFDFDRLTDPDVSLPTDPARLQADLYRHWEGKQEEIAAIDRLDRVAWPVVSAEGKEMAKGFIKSAAALGMTAEQSYNQFLNASFGDIQGEFLHALAVLLMLSAKNATEGRVENRDKINKARRKRGEPELLTHIVTYLKLGKGERTRGVRPGDGALGGFGGRRPHMVRGHLVTRGGVIFWRRAHMRCLDGGEAPTRTIKVTL
jgi:hypothetical protein